MPAKIFDNVLSWIPAEDIECHHKHGQSIGRGVIKVRGTRVAVRQHSASMTHARIIARNP